MVVVKSLAFWLKSRKYFDLSLVHLELEFRAHILCVSSTHVLYLNTEYEPRTPILTGQTREISDIFEGMRLCSCTYFKFIIIVFEQN